MSRLLRAGAAAGPASNAERSPAPPRPPRASGPVRAEQATRDDAQADDQPAARGFSFQDLPSGLASLIFHFSVLIVLGLVVTERAKPHLTEVTVDWQQGDNELAGGGGGKDGLDKIDAAPETLDQDWTKAADELTGAVPTTDTLVADASTMEMSEFATQTADLAPMAGASESLSDLAAMGTYGMRSIGTGGGTGGGKGKGEGPGIGDGIGPGSATGVFGIRDEGSRIVYVFDRSESMNSVYTLNSEGRSKSITPLEAAKTELSKSINELSEGTEFSMVFYNHEPNGFPDPYAVNGLSKADARTKDYALQFIYQLPARGNTNHIAALEMALMLKPDVIFLMTDGEEKDDLTTGDLRRLQNMARRSGTRINVINFVPEERPNGTLVSLATRTKGQFKAILIRTLIDPKW